MKPVSSILVGFGIVAAIAIALFFAVQYSERQRSAPRELSESASAEYAKNTTLDFARAIQAGDLSQFLKTTSEEFQNEFSIRQFEEAFGSFIAQRINLMAVQNYQPSFVTPPGLDKNGMLVLRGYFPTRPSRIHFNYRYKWKAPEWKIADITIDVQPEKQQESPPAAK